jgi:hypothetical protein
MTPTEAGMLLTVAAAFDNRKPDKDAAMAWGLALGDLPFVDCRDAIVAHYSTSSEWLMPAMVSRAVRKVRRDRLEDHPPLTPPPDLTPLETNAWLKDARRRVADGEHVDCDQAYGVLKPRVLSDLKALMPAPSVVSGGPDEQDTP